MGFFDDVLLTDGRPAAPEVQTVRPARFGPPEGWVLPTVLPVVRELGRSPNARIALVGVRCWPDGVSLDVRLLCRTRPASQPRRDGQVSAEWSFRFGVQYADRRRAAVGEFPPAGPPAPTGWCCDRPSAMVAGSTGTGTSTSGRCRRRAG